MYLSLICVILLFFAWLIKRKQWLKNMEKIECVRGWLPVIGHYLIMKEREELLERLTTYHKMQGKTLLAFAGLEPILVTMDQKVVEVILGSTSLTKKSIEYTYLARWFGDGLLTSTGYKWKSHRKILTPSFHYKILEDFVETFETKGNSLINNLRNEIGKKSFDVMDLISLYTLDVICETAMGTSVDAQNNPNHEFPKAIKIYCEMISKRVASPLGRIDFFYKFSSWYREECKAANVMNEFSTGIVSEKRKTPKEQHEEIEKRVSTFVDIILESTIDGKYLNDREIIDEVNTFLFGGHDTTTITISMILYNLGKYPDIQKKVYEEITDVFGDDSTQPATIDDLQNLKYLDLVIKESLRLYSAVALHGRMALQDIKFDNFVIPKGVVIFINQYGLHRDPEIYPDPYSFIPERFTQDNQAKRLPYTYIPFSAGPRNCIGQRFAMLELKSAVCKILRNFEIIPATPFYEPIFYATITTQSANGVQIALKDRLS